MRQRKHTGGLAIVLLLLVAACTTTQQRTRPGGESEYVIACGAALGWNVCYKRANEVCPGGYTTLSEDAGFNRKELRIACPATQQPAATK
jgi:hypothetical protein